MVSSFVNSSIQGVDSYYTGVSESFFGRFGIDPPLLSESLSDSGSEFVFLLVCGRRFGRLGKYFHVCIMLPFFLFQGKLLRSVL